MDKCQHGVYDPSGTEVAEYCQICTPRGAKPLSPSEQRSLDDLAKMLKPEQVPFNPLPYGRRRCPRCGSPKFKYANDYDFHCRKCGFDALTG